MAGARRFMVRTGKGNPQAAALPLGEPMVMGERPMPGFWLGDGDACAASLPPK
jgi:hypothetical protein